VRREDPRDVVAIRARLVLPACRATLGRRMRRPRPAALAVLLALVPAGRAAARAAEEAPLPRGSDLGALRFAWPDRVEARVSYRRTRARPDRPREAFTARFTSRALRAEEGWRIETTGASWEGALPFPPGFAAQALRASERVVEVVDEDGAFERLEGTDAMRAVLAKLYGLAEVPREQADRAVDLALGAMRAEAEELWNLEAGFWIGAELELGRSYVLRSEGSVPLLPGARAPLDVTFGARRRVPCAATEREPRCVELTLRTAPVAAALRRVAPELAHRLAGPDAPPPGPDDELSAEAELLLVTDPATLLPRHLVWTRTARLVAKAVEREEVDRSEYEWRYHPAAERVVKRPAPKRPVPAGDPPLSTRTVPPPPAAYEPGLVAAPDL